jgi:hypothetical protein
LCAALALDAGARSVWPSCPPAAFRQDLESPQAGDLYLRVGRVSCTTLEIDIVAHGVEGAFTLSFDLRYPADLLKFEGHAPGPLLAKGAPRTPPLFLVRREAGRVQASLTRFAPDGAVAAEGSETILTLRFSRVAPGSGTVDFVLGADSTVAERILDHRGQPVSARFGPGHGGVATFP